MGQKHPLRIALGLLVRHLLVCHLHLADQAQRLTYGSGAVTMTAAQMLIKPRTNAGTGLKGHACKASSHELGLIGTEEALQRVASC